jgi:hypothetical protein
MVHRCTQCKSISWLFAEQACMKKMIPFNGTFFVRRTFGYVFESFSLYCMILKDCTRVIRVLSSQAGVLLNPEF